MLQALNSGYSLIPDNSSRHVKATIDFRNEAAQRYVHRLVVLQTLDYSHFCLLDG